MKKINLIIILIILIGCNVENNNSETIDLEKGANEICNQENSYPNFEEFFKCGTYKTVKIRKQNFVDGKLRSESKEESNFPLIILERKGKIMCVIMESYYTSGFFGEDVVPKTPKNKVSSTTSKIGGATFFNLKIENFEEVGCSGEYGIYKYFNNFRAEIIGHLAKCQYDFKFCYKGKTYRVLIDSTP